MVVAQLEERLLWIPDVRGLTPVISEIYIEHLFVYLFFINCIEKTKLNKKRRGRPTFFLKKEKVICSHPSHLNQKWHCH